MERHVKLRKWISEISKQQQQHRTTEKLVPTECVWCNYYFACTHSAHNFTSLIIFLSIVCLYVCLTTVDHVNEKKKKRRNNWPFRFGSFVDGSWTGLIVCLVSFSVQCLSVFFLLRLLRNTCLVLCFEKLHFTDMKVMDTIVVGFSFVFSFVVQVQVYETISDLKCLRNGQS